MAFNIRRLDNLDYDDAEPILEEYITGIVAAFLASERGQNYAAADPEAGNWIGTFVGMAYRYEGLTLPKMTDSDVRNVMEYILPRKVALFDPHKADTAVPELIAFWQFLRETYRLRQASKIVRYLETIGDRFPTWMVDPNRGGIAKQFIQQGIEAGYDMTSSEGLEAFKDIYNQRIQESPQPPSLPDAVDLVPMTAPPPEIQALFEQFGVELPPVGTLVDPREIAMKTVTMLQQLADEVEVEAGEEDEGFAKANLLVESLCLPSSGESLQSIFAHSLASQLSSTTPLAEEQKSVLQAQKISATEPGTILRDFQTIIEFVGSDGIEVSSKRNQLPLKRLSELNESLCQPIQIAFKRPQQRSYPPIHGLYLLLRATSLARVVAKGKKNFLVLNPSLYEIWQQLNPTEQYFTLLEAWMIRSNGEILGEDTQSFPLSSGCQCLQAWPELERLAKRDRQTLTYRPGLHNLALLNLFGLVTVKTAQPKTGEGWAIQEATRTPFGLAILAALKNAFLETNLLWPSESDSSLPFQELKPTFEPYFPEWKNVFTPPQPTFRSGRYIFKVTLDKIWRRIAIDSDATLAHLSSLILASVEFGSDHLGQFTYIDPIGRKIEAVHPYTGTGDLYTTEVTIGSLPLSVGSRMEYVFGFGNWWEFEVQLEAIEDKPESAVAKGFQKVQQSKQRRRKMKQQPLGTILESHGQAPPQYPDYDEM